jgi:hypothetical protein
MCDRKDRYDVVFGWAIDFVRALMERNKLLRLLFRLIVGKYAYREFIGMIEEMNKGHYFNIGYCLEGQEYHKDKKKWDFEDHISSTPTEISNNREAIKP